MGISSLTLVDALFEELSKSWGDDPTHPKPPREVDVAVESSPLVRQAKTIADWLDKTAVAGGDGKEFEQATEEAFKFLGFRTQLISGSGNPDVMAAAPMGKKSYRVLIDSKSRASGVVQQNDVNFHVLEKQKQNAGADYVAIVGADFAGGNLAEFAIKNNVRLLTTSNLRELLLLHAESVFAFDTLRPLFLGGGATDDSLLPEIQEAAQSQSDLMLLVRKVFAAVYEYQGQAGAINTDSLYFILKGEHLLPTIKLAVGFLRSDMIGALGETDRGSLYTRVSPTTLTNKLLQITRAMDLSQPAMT